MKRVCLFAQVMDTEAEVAAPEFRMGPVEGATANAVATKAEDFLLPANALVSQIP